MVCEAWITSATEDKVVHKAMTLASSLRRVRTARKLVVFVTLAVSKDLRMKLKRVFDSVLLLEQDTPNGWNLEDYAKIQALSLRVFDKCVYISPNALVLKNSDEIFSKYSTFASTGRGRRNHIDTSVFVFAPHQIDDRAFDQAAHYANSVRDFSKCFYLWLKNNVPEMQELDDQYNSLFNLRGNSKQRMDSNISIVNFVDIHPLEIPGHKITQEMGVMEKFAVDQCWRIFLEDVKTPTWNTIMPHCKKEPIAVVGMSCRLPGGNNLDEFWSLLAEGRSGIIPLPSHRWTKNHTYSPCKNRKIEGGFLSIPLDEFDSKFFGLSPKEAEFLDPQQRLLLELTWEAFEEAMIDPIKMRGSQSGVFVGSWVHDYRDIAVHSPDVDFFRGYMGNSLATTAARLSHFLELTGPSIATESGCSSAIAAVDMACKYLQAGSSPLAIAASVNLLLHPFEPKLMEYVLAPDFRCKTFDASANGFVRAEGCTVFLLKRLSDAVRDEDNIWGIIRGSALTQEGVSKSLGTPTVHCESLAMELALKEADVAPKDVDYLEAHGTGTAVGDPLEIKAIEKVYSKGRSEPLLIGSVKTNVGHTEAASGMTGMIKVLLSMKNEVIPKHLNLNELNPELNLDAIPARIPLEPVHWPKKEGNVRIAGVSSFGISGCDGHAIIEEPPEVFHPQMEFQHEHERPLHIMKLSTKSIESMNDLIQKYLKIFNDKIERGVDSPEEFANLAYSANIGRATFNHRLVFTAKNFREAVDILEKKSYMDSDVQSSGSSLCFLFTGQGSQHPRMAQNLYLTSPVFKDNFDKCDDILQKRYDISLKEIIWKETEELNRTLYSQTSIFVVEYCLLKLWESWGVKPDYVMGHSLGEFAAAVAAGALDIEDALMLVAERSRLIDQLPRGKMLVIKADKRKVNEMISEFQEIKKNFWVDIAALNSPEQTVVAGDSELIEEYSKFCEGKAIKTVILAATHAFHSRHMDSMLEAYRNVAMAVKKPLLGESSPKFISGMEGKLINLESIDADYWVRHTREKVRYMDACKVIQEEECTLFLEVGPHPILSALTLMYVEKSQITCLPSLRRNHPEWVTMFETLSKLYLSSWKGEIDWKGFDSFYPRRKVPLPFYPFQRKSIWAKCKSKRPILHPLVGKGLPTASNETIFQNNLTLRNVPYVKDHVMGETVIFPGAAFLEMCLSGGHATVQGLTENLVKPRRPISLKNFQIQTPLGFPEEGVCKLQTMVSLGDEKDDELGYSVGVSRHVEGEDGSGRWIHHASGKFLPMTTTSPSTESINLEEIQSNWERSDSRSNFYNKLPDIGVRFGPTFQSLEGGWKSEEGVCASVKVPVDFLDYLIHPLLADAMLQAFLIWTYGDKPMKLQVPVQVKEFIWFKETHKTNQFVYCSNDEKGENYCLLLDDEGTVLAMMKGMDFMETSVKLLEGMITQQSMAMPKLWMDVWKGSDGPMQGSFTHKTTEEILTFSEDELKEFERLNEISEEEIKFYRNLIQLMRLSVLKALYGMGWKPETGESFSVDEIIKSLNIKNGFLQYIQFFFRSMTKDECLILREIDGESGRFEFVNAPPTRDDLAKGLKSVTSPSDYAREEYKLMMEIDKFLIEILTGKIHPLTHIFPEDPLKPSAVKVYKSQIELQIFNFPAAAIRASKHLENAELSYSGQGKPIYRVLEIGAGTGMSTKRYLEYVIPKNRSSKVEYFFTDVSPAFFQSSLEKELEDYEINLLFKKYDMDEDPLEQGLCPEYFDMILATEVLHAAKDIKKTLKVVRSLLKPGGLMGIDETICADERITFVFGLLEGYWHFEDREFRRYHNTLTPEMWREAMEEAGFEGVSIVPMYNNVHGNITAFAKPLKNKFLENNLSHPRNSWIIFGNKDDFSEMLQQKLENFNRKCIVIPKPAEELTEISMENLVKNALEIASRNGGKVEGVLYLWSLSPGTRDQSQVSLPFVTLMKFITELKNFPKVFAIMRGTCPIESSDVIDPTPGTLVGFCKALSNEALGCNVTYLDLDPMKNALDQIHELFMNLWVEHKQGAAFRDGQRLRPKLTAAKIPRSEPLTLPSGCDRFQLFLPKTRLISDLEFAYLDHYTLGEGEVEVEVKAVALNFRDVFTVLKPIPEFEKFNTVGVDFGGVIVRVGNGVTRAKVGDRVFGLVNDNISLASHHKVEENDLIPLPDGLTFAEGACFPTVFCTVVLFLVRLAKLKKGETVLVHTASGGVGLVAIQICKHYGAKMIATAGSKRKRNYLRGLGVEHVFHSRTTVFKDKVLEVTRGKGVDIVLNTLTGPGFKEASLETLGRNGRFIEISKLNVWTKEEVKVLRPDVFYEAVDLSLMERPVIQSLTDELVKMVEAGSLRPIAYERFDALNIRGALNYLRKAEHIGKIVCIMPEVKLEKSKLVTITPLFNGDSTYLVTGGLGGIGFEVVKWMLRNGGNHIAIMSRNPPKPEIGDEIKKWNKSGKHVQAFSIDVGNYDQLKALLEELKNSVMGFPQVRGVMHAAGVLHDALLENQSWDTFTQTYNPKVNGSWNLHDLTKDCVLEHFVLFSSIASKFGSPGQTNHSASNAFEDSLAAYRNSVGLPATSVNWGNWGEVGVATEIDFPGIRPISTGQGLLALETFLRTQTTTMSVLNVESFSLALKLFPQVKHYVDDLRLFGETKNSSVEMLMNSDEFWREVDSSEDRQGKIDCFKKLIKTVVRNILKMDRDEVIDDDMNFQTLGIDSLMVLEMKNALQNILGGRMLLSAGQLKDCNNTEMLATTLVTIMEGEDTKENNDDLRQVIRDDSDLLPETLSVENLERKTIDQVETLLLTGVTGNLGPYLLRELTKRCQVKLIYCLIRPKDELSGMDRLKLKLEEFNLHEDVDMSKVEVIEGDLNFPQFGLEDDLYLKLSKDVDAIIHSAVMSDPFAKYSDVRTVNVLGTLHLLEFAALRRVKQFFHASTLLTFTGTGKDGEFSEGWQAISAFDNAEQNSLGYVISRHVSEQLVHQALKRGIPCKAFRFPAISGDSKTGRINPTGNHLILRWLTCMKLGLFPDIPAPLPLLPVDHCAKISMDIFFNPEAPMEVYNILQRSLEVEPVLVEVAHSFGVEMEIVSYESFMEKLKIENGKEDNEDLMNLFVEKESEFISMFMNPSNLALRKYFEEGESSEFTSKLGKYTKEYYENLVESTRDVLKRDFRYLKTEGVFEKYGIRTSSSNIG